MSVFNNQSVRDLEWLIKSQPLIKIPGIDYFDYKLDDEWLAELDKNPAQLEKDIAERQRISLGSYFETLFAFWLKNIKNMDILARNLQVFDGNETKGEFDFIIDDSGIKKHIEVAVKFYLGTGDTTKWKGWHGPNAKDRLDIKLERLISHQLNLAKSDGGGAALERIGIREIERQIFIKGYFFYPHGENILPPEGAGNSNSGWWIRKRDIKKIIKEGEWAVLPKPLWFSPAIMKNGNNIIAHDGFCQMIDESKLPQMVVKLAKVGDYYMESERGFIVSDNWPNLL